jgi:hypothetical protein
VLEGWLEALLPKDWFEAWSAPPVVLVEVKKLPDEKMQAFAREMANLEELTGITFILMVNDTSPWRATALRNGQKIAIAADPSLTQTERPDLAEPLLGYLQRLAAKLDKQSDILFTINHTKGDGCLEGWLASVEAGAVKGKHWIFGLCPPRTPALHSQVVQAALDPARGKAASVTTTNQPIDIVAFTMAIQSIVERMDERARKGLVPVQLLRRGYEVSWQRLKRCLDQKDPSKRAEAIRREFDRELAQAILILLQEKQEQGGNGIEYLERVLREEPRYFNGLTFRAPRGDGAPSLPA